MTQEINRWCIFIDILGFSKFWECNRNVAYASLGALMQGIFAIGSKSYPESPKRLFAHQMGDGFAIVSDSGESSLERPIAIASALMRYVAGTTGIFTAATIAEGDFADIIGCYPSEIFRENNRSNGVDMVDMGEGLMGLFSVMGTAFIRAYRVAKKAPSGPFLTIDSDQNGRIPDGIPYHVTSDRNGNQSLCSIDWVRYESDPLAHIRKTVNPMGICINSSSVIEHCIQEYCKHYPRIGDKWRDNLYSLLDIKIGEKAKSDKTTPN